MASAATNAATSPHAAIALTACLRRRVSSLHANGTSRRSPDRTPASAAIARSSRPTNNSPPAIPSIDTRGRSDAISSTSAIIVAAPPASVALIVY